MNNCTYESLGKFTHEEMAQYTHENMTICHRAKLAMASIKSNSQKGSYGVVRSLISSKVKESVFAVKKINKNMLKVITNAYTGGLRFTSKGFSYAYNIITQRNKKAILNRVLLINDNAILKGKNVFSVKQAISIIETSIKKAIKRLINLGYKTSSIFNKPARYIKAIVQNIKIVVPPNVKAINNIVYGATGIYLVKGCNIAKSNMQTKLGYIVSLLRVVNKTIRQFGIEKINANLGKKTITGIISEYKASISRGITNVVSNKVVNAKADAELIKSKMWVKLVNTYIKFTSIFEVLEVHVIIKQIISQIKLMNATNKDASKISAIVINNKNTTNMHIEKLIKLISNISAKNILFIEKLKTSTIKFSNTITLQINKIAVSASKISNIVKHDINKFNIAKMASSSEFARFTSSIKRSSIKIVNKRHIHAGANKKVLYNIKVNKLVKMLKYISSIIMVSTSKIIGMAKANISTIKNNVLKVRQVNKINISIINISNKVMKLTSVIKYTMLKLRNVDMFNIIKYAYHSSISINVTKQLKQFKLINILISNTDGLYMKINKSITSKANYLVKVLKFINKKINISQKIVTNIKTTLIDVKHIFYAKINGVWKELTDLYIKTKLGWSKVLELNKKDQGKWINK